MVRKEVVEKCKDYEIVKYEIVASERWKWIVEVMEGKGWKDVLSVNGVGDKLTNLTWKEKEVLNDFVSRIRNFGVFPEI